MSRNFQRYTCRGGLITALLLASAPVLASSCWQLLHAGPQPVADCRPSGQVLLIGANGKQQLVHDKDGLSRLLAAGRFYHHHRTGRLLQVAAMDNGPDDFRHGLVRGWVDGQLGYFDVQLRPQIRPQFDGGLPFDPVTGTAWVCRGCQLTPASADTPPALERRPALADRHARQAIAVTGAGAAAILGSVALA